MGPYGTSPPLLSEATFPRLWRNREGHRAFSRRSEMRGNTGSFLIGVCVCLRDLNGLAGDLEERSERLQGWYTRSCCFYEFMDAWRVQGGIFEITIPTKLMILWLKTLVLLLSNQRHSYVLLQPSYTGFTLSISSRLNPSPDEYVELVPFFRVTECYLLDESNRLIFVNAELTRVCDHAKRVRLLVVFLDQERNLWRCQGIMLLRFWLLLWVYCDASYSTQSYAVCEVRYVFL